MTTREQAGNPRPNPAEEVRPIASVAEDTELTEVSAETIKLVYNCDFLSPSRFVATMSNLNATLKFYAQSPLSVKIAISFHHHGFNFLMKSYERGTIAHPYASREGFTRHEFFRDQLRALHDQGVAMRACRNTMLKLGLGPDDLWPFVKIIASGFVWVAELQSRYGYAYGKTAD